VDAGDAELHDKHFSGLSQFVMLVKPSHQRPAKAAVYIRDENGRLNGSGPAAQMQLMPGPVDADLTAGPAGHLPDVRLKKEAKKAMPWGKIAGWLVAALLLVGLTVGGLQWNQHRMEAQAGVSPLKLQASVDGAVLKASWNPASEVLRDINGAKLQAGDVVKELSKAEVMLGTYAIDLTGLPAGDIEVRLTAGGVEESARLILAAR
jgi:hypothetical protein